MQLNEQLKMLIWSFPYCNLKDRGAFFKMWHKLWSRKYMYDTKSRQNFRHISFNHHNKIDGNFMATENKLKLILG